VKIHTAKYLTGTVRVPGDKSISHRAVMLASIAEGVTRITNFAPGEDCASTVECMRALGVRIEREGSDVTVHGVGKHGLTKPAGPLDCGNSGTTMRLLAGILAGQPFESVVTGDDSLRSRPMGRIIEPLLLMGARVEAEDGRAPLTIRGVEGKLSHIRYETPVPSAQVKSCVLLAGLFADGTTEVIETVATRDHTERMLRAFGAASEGKTIIGDAVLTGCDIHVPGDISAAAFFMVAAACRPGSDVTLVGVGVNPTRAALIDVLTDLGADLHVAPVDLENAEPSADMTIKGGLRPGGRAVIDGDVVAKIIDEIPALAVLGTQLGDGLEVRGAGELRVKESDRILAVVENLRAMGASVTEFDDGFRVERSHLKAAAVDSRGDHRIAMAFAIAGLIADGETEISNAEAASVSYPAFFDDLEALAVR